MEESMMLALSKTWFLKFGGSNLVQYPGWHGWHLAPFLALPGLLRRCEEERPVGHEEVRERWEDDDMDMTWWHASRNGMNICGICPVEAVFGSWQTCVGSRFSVYKPVHWVNFLGILLWHIRWGWSMWSYVQKDGCNWVHRVVNDERLGSLWEVFFCKQQYSRFIEHIATQVIGYNPEQRWLATFSTKPSILGVNMIESLPWY